MRNFLRNNIGAAIGSGLGAIQGSGVFENEEEKGKTNLAGRLGKLALGTVSGAAIGKVGQEGLAYGRKQLANRPIDVSSNAVNTTASASQPNNVGGIPDVVENVGENLRGFAEKAKARKAARDAARPVREPDLRPPDPRPFWNRPLWGDRSGVDKFRDLTGFANSMKNFANFDSPQMIDAQIRLGTTYIPQETQGINAYTLGDPNYNIKLKRKAKNNKKKMVLPASVIYDKKKIKTFLDSEDVNDNL